MSLGAALAMMLPKRGSTTGITTIVMTLAACVSIIPEGVLLIWWLILEMSGPFL